MTSRKRHGPLHGSARGVGYVVAVGFLVLLGGVAISFVLTWAMS